MNSIADHLWQSTLFAGVVWLLTLALRKNHARVRHGLWLAASCKFLIPFSAFVALGSLVPRRTAPAITLPTLVVMDEISQPFSAPAAAVIAPPVPSAFPAIVLAVWACGCFGITCAWWVRWRRIRAAVRAGSPVLLGLPIKTRSSPTLLEPGVFGIFRPILLLPEGIFDRLTPAQLQAVIAHELCHVRHRDNLIATVHMFVETVFWFHPLVWWIGKRMVEERERACDEEVLRDLGEPKAYAEGILNVCKLYVESPLTCVSGVSGANLKKRIEAIMSNNVVLRLNLAKKAVLATAGIVALAIPVAIGVLNAPLIRAQSQPPETAAKFEAASIKPCAPSPGVRGKMSATPGRLHATCLPLYNLASIAYGVGFRFPLQERGPDWIKSDGYSIEATAGGNPGALTMEGPMLQALLEDRFKLKIGRESREVPVYALTVAKGGFKLRPLTQGSCTPFDALKPPASLAPADLKAAAAATCATASTIGLRKAPTGRVTADFHGITLDDFSKALDRAMDRDILDRTGITGMFDIHMEFAPDEAVPAFMPGGRLLGFAGPPNPAAQGDPVGGPSIFTAIQEQLGLKLEGAKAPREFFSIDHVERPSEN